MGGNKKTKISFKFQVLSFKKLLLCVLVFLFWFSITQGATLYLEPSSGQYHQGDTFIVEARIDTENECINTVKANLSFSNDILKAVDFSRGNSILTIWLETPKIDQKSGEISFIGGIPGGFCGSLPGEPGKPNLLGKIIFQVKETDRGQSSEVKFLESSEVLLNDGLGTPAKLSFKNAVFEILPKKNKVPKNEWKNELEKDNIPPEPFEIMIHQDPNIFEGKYFITFFTTDKQTGIDHYQVKEGKRAWKRAESPYLLEDQSLTSIIKVKAIDKAGNERISEYLPAKKITWKDWLAGIIFVVVAAGVIYWLWKKYTKKYK